MNWSLLGYCDPLTVRPGERLRLMVGCAEEPVEYSVELLRIVCADVQPEGDGFRVETASGVELGVAVASRQRIDLGSRIVVPASDALTELTSFTIQSLIWPTAPERAVQVVLGTWDAATSFGFALATTPNGGLAVFLGDGEGKSVVVETGVPLRPRTWVRATAAYDAPTGVVRLVQDAIPAPNVVSPVSDRIHVARMVGEIDHTREAVDITVAAARSGVDERGTIFDLFYDGKIEAPRLIKRALVDEPDIEQLADSPSSFGSELLGSWDFSTQVGKRTIKDTSPHGHNGQVLNLPTQAVAGHKWDGRVHNWRTDPSHYAAIHFHSDDIYDAGWPTSHEFEIPSHWRSGIYAARLSSGEVDDYVPFFVAPPGGQMASDVAFLASTATYLAYANFTHPMDVGVRNNGTLRVGPSEFGPSCYHQHVDGSGVHHSSHLRPLINLRPRSTLWGWNADTLITGWLEASGCDYDVITDHLLHEEGTDLISPYRVLITGTHPEYWTTQMRSALESFLRSGGRLMYLGGNGFYWRIALSSEWPGAIELRRAEDGTRMWISEPGEYYHAWGGELGGLWRRVGRPPNLLVGVGFTAQGFSRAIGYQRQTASNDPRADFIFQGIQASRIGAHGRLGGAAGEEIDRHDVDLGSPPHSLILATATGFGTDMLKTKEEFFATLPPRPDDPDIRADLVFFETSAGGAVFSTGSIAWAGSLGTNDYDNDVAQLSANVLTRFRDPELFAAPEGP